MGKIIVNNIKGMGWKARVGLIGICSILLCAIIFNVWRDLKPAHAAVQNNGWTSIGNSSLSAYPYTGTVSYTTPAGANNRTLALMITAYTAAQTTITPTITYNGVAMTSAQGDLGTSQYSHTAIYYLKEASLPAAGTAANFSINLASGTGTSGQVIIYATTLSNTDQGGAMPTGNTTTSSGTPTGNATLLTFATAMNEAQYSQPLAIVGAAPGNSTTLGAVPWGTWNLPALGAVGNESCVGSTTTLRAIALTKTINDVAAGSTTRAVQLVSVGNNSTRVSMTAMSFNTATTTLGNGLAGVGGTIPPPLNSSNSNKLDGFSFVTSSTGTTDSVTSLTVAVTNPTTIASMAVYDEAGTTQYFSTINNPTTSVTFTGGTPIPVTGTLANYKIMVNYKTRAQGALSGTNSTQANVTGYVSSNVQASGSDTADTVITISNIHAASAWGNCTVGDAKVSLNWTYGTTGQNVLIVRYNGSTADTKKPDDGTPYTLGSVFGSGGIVRYVGAPPTQPLVDSVGLTNGQTYYYKIFEFDTYTYYYNATDIWTVGLTPVSPDSVPPTVDAGFAPTTPVNSLVIPLNSTLQATDNPGGSGVAAYMITTSSTDVPLASDVRWILGAPPTTYTVGGQGSYPLYPWAKDAGGNVSPLYGSPVTVVVDLTAPTITTFTVTTPVASINIPVTFVANDTGGSGINGYMITTTPTPPAFDSQDWDTVVPTTFSVPSDGTYTLYPWVRDAAGNVSSVFGSGRSVQVDTTAPTGLTLTSPADEAVDLPLATSMTCSTATDAGGNGVQYWFQVDGDNGSSFNSGWISGTTYSPALTKGVRYVWKVKVKDNLGNESAYSTQRSFTIIAECRRFNPTITALTPSGGIASTISQFDGTTDFIVRIWNNDTGDCGNTTFNLSLVDNDPDSRFEDSYFVDTGTPVKSISLPVAMLTPTQMTIRTKSSPNQDTGVMSTIVKSAADGNHDETTSGLVQTTLNVVTCVAKTPLLIVGPDSGYLNKAGNFVYTITVKNTDTGSACGNVVYNFTTPPSETNSTDFNVSQFSPTSLTLGSGQLGSATLTVSAKANAARNALNQTTVHISATGHTSPADISVRTTVNNPMLHNSANVNSTKWSVSGGWGVPNGRYGEILCETCHVGGGGDTSNIKRINQHIYTPYTSNSAPKFPGHGQTIAYRRYVGTSPTLPLLGWDSTATPRTTSFKVCEACHTYDATGTNGVKAHPYNTAGATLGNHFNTDGKNCTTCHKHNAGFGASNMPCTGCHGNNSISVVTADNRYVVAPPTSSAGNSGSITGTGEVSNDPKVGAHQTHVRYLNGFSNYSSYDYRCQGCHGTLPTDFTHANGSSPMNFQGVANNRGARTTATFSSANLTCNNTYCHNPAGTGGTLAAANAGFAIQPSWTSASYLSNGGKTDANCNRCHKVPGSANFTFQGSHSQSTVVGYDCSGCHGHNGDTAGEPGKRHIDGIRYYGGHTFPYAGSTHMGLTTAPWTSCTACHTNGSNSTYPVARGTAPDCTSCHINTLRTATGNPSCYDCHGSSATDGKPSGNVFPNISGSHTKHMALSGVTCATCHANGGTGSPNHGSSNGVASTDITFVHVSSSSKQFHFTATGRGSCSTNVCHPTAEWGVTKLSCNGCHAYDSTDAGTTWLPALYVGGAGAGAHAKHINVIKNLIKVPTLTPSGQIFGQGEAKAVCGTCHTNDPVNHTMMAVGGRTIDFGTSTNTMGSGTSYQMTLLFGASTPSFSSGAKSCSNLMCHFSTTPSWY